MSHARSESDVPITSRELDRAFWTRSARPTRSVLRVHSALTCFPYGPDGHTFCGDPDLDLPCGSDAVPEPGLSFLIFAEALGRRKTVQLLEFFSHREERFSLTADIRATVSGRGEGRPGGRDTVGHFQS